MRTVLLRVTLAITASAALVVTAFAAPAGAKVPGPNGRIAFARFDPALGDTVTYTVNPDGSHQRQLFFSGPSGFPRWSPDGSQVSIGTACTDGTETCAATIVDPDSGTFRQFKWPDPTLETDCGIWSSDGQRLACEGFGVTDPSRNGIYTIRSSDGGGLTRITSNPGGDDGPIDYSPDGKQLVFNRTDPHGPPGNNQALFVVNVDGSGLHRITPWGFSDGDGSWSPDGTKIGFEHSGSLFTVHPDGTALAKIPLATSSQNRAGDVSWSPDGKKIVFLLITQRGPGTGQEGIATANADGSHVQQATISPTFDHQPDWGPHPITG